MNSKKDKIGSSLFDNDYDITEAAGRFEKMDQLANEALVSDAAGSILVGPLGGMIGGPLGDSYRLAAIPSLTNYISESNTGERRSD